MAHVSANVVQQSFRARNDDGSESAATWIDVANANWTQNADEAFRVRFLIEETAGGSANNYSYLVQYSINGGAWTTQATTGAVHSTASAFVADATATTQQLGAGSFIAGEFDSDAGASNITLSAQQTEMEYCLILDSSLVSDGDSIQLRVTNGGTALDGYTNTPTITASVAAAAITGTLAAQEAGSDVSTASGTVAVSGSAAAQESGADVFSATGSSLSGYPALVMDDSPIAYWRLGEPSGTIAASETGSHNGTYVGSPTLAAASLLAADADTCVDFAPSDADYVDIPDAAELNPSAAITLEAWFNADTFPTSYPRIICKDSTVSAQAWQLLIDNTASPVPYFRIKSGGIWYGGSFSTSIAAGQTYHIVGTYDGNTLRVYVNGAEDATTYAHIGTIQSDAGPVRIGRHSNTTSAYFDGRIDEVAVYNTALSAARITAHYDEGSGDAVTGTLATQETGADSFASSGSVGVSGDLAAQESGQDSFAGSGVVVVSGSLIAQESGADLFTGSGDVAIAGAFSAQETGTDTFAASGTVTEAGVTGTLSAQETGSDVLAGSGSVAVAGSLASQETGTDTLSGSGDVVVTGTLASQESGADTLAGSGTVSVSGAFSAQELGSDTAALSGDVAVSGSLSTQESGTDTFSGTASSTGAISGTLSAQESGEDTVAASGSVSVEGALAATESGQDGFSSSGLVLIQGGLSAQESGTDTLSASGAVTTPSATGSLVAQEPGADTFTGLALVAVNGQLVTQETGSDVFTGEGEKLWRRRLTVQGRTLEVNGRTLEVNGRTLEVNGRTLEVNGRVLTIGSRAAEV